MRRDDRPLSAGSINAQKVQIGRILFAVFVHSRQNYKGACRGAQCGLQGLFTSGIIRAENKIVRQRQGAPTPHRLQQATHRPMQQNFLHRRDIIPISPPYGKRIFRTARDYYSLCSAFLFPHIFIIRRQNHGKAKSGSSPSRRTSYGTLVGSPADCTRPCPARHPPSCHRQQ